MGSPSSAKPKTATNGTLKFASNNGAGAGAEVCSKKTSYHGHDREEVTRLLIQALEDMGYEEAAEAVKRESGFTLENAEVGQFKAAVLQGAWDEVSRLLKKAAVASPEGHHDGNGLVLVHGTNKMELQFWVLEHRYYELLQTGAQLEAALFLRNQLTPLCGDVDHLNFLSTLIMCSTPEEVMATARAQGVQVFSRSALLARLAAHISSSVMLAQHRLATLLSEAKESQVLRCLFHIDKPASSLYTTHRCKEDNFPLEMVCSFDMRPPDEIWEIKFSHDGKRLAACGSSRKILILSVPSLTKLHELDVTGTEEGTCNLAWSPDDSKLVSCGMDKRAILWDTKTGRQLRIFDKQRAPSTGCAWLADGQSFLLSTLDGENSIVQYNSRGTKTGGWSQKQRFIDISLSPDQRLLATLTFEFVYIYDLASKEELNRLDLTDFGHSICFTKDSNFLLVNTKQGEILLFSTLSWLPAQRYKVPPAKDCILRCKLGGADENFVVCASEAGDVYIFHRVTGVEVLRLRCHQQRCNSVAWNDVYPRMFATCGDDHTIKLWSTKSYYEMLLEQEPPADSANGSALRDDEDLPPHDNKGKAPQRDS